MVRILNTGEADRKAANTSRVTVHDNQAAHPSAHTRTHARMHTLTYFCQGAGRDQAKHALLLCGGVLGVVHHFGCHLDVQLGRHLLGGQVGGVAQGNVLQKSSKMDAPTVRKNNTTHKMDVKAKPTVHTQFTHMGL